MIQNIQALRGFAALIVVFYHVQAHLNAYVGSDIRWQFGAVGVDIFFVISGFVMFYTNQGCNRGAFEFIRDRIIRIVPLYWIGTFFLLAIFATGKNPDGLQAVDGYDILTSLLFIPELRSDGVSAPILSLGWTLIHEMFFYLCFSLTFFLRKIGERFLLLSVMLVLFAASRPWADGHYAWTMLSNSIIIEFLFGGALALAFARKMNWMVSQFGVSLGLFMIFIGAFLVIGLEFFPDYAVLAKGNYRFLVYGIPSMFIVAGFLILERNGWALKSPLLQFLGAASFAIYLFHPAVIQAAALGARGAWKFFDPQAWLVATANGWAALVVAFVALIAAMIAGSLVHIFVERPITRQLKNRLTERSSSKRSYRGYA